MIALLLAFVALLVVVPLVANAARPWWSRSSSPYAFAVRRARKDLRAKLPGDRVIRRRS